MQLLSKQKQLDELNSDMKSVEAGRLMVFVKRTEILKY